MMVSRTLGAVLSYHTHIAIQDCVNVVDLVLAIHGIHGKTGGTSTLMKPAHQHNLGRIVTTLGAEVSTSGKNH